MTGRLLEPFFRALSLLCLVLGIAISCTPPDFRFEEKEAPSSCVDKAWNGTETDTDCGGGSCPACNVGGGCRADRDCGGGLPCQMGHCQLPTCLNEIQDVDQGESDEDCGGPGCPPCSRGQSCNGDTDCDAKNYCLDKRCQSNRCKDGDLNGN